MASYYLAFDLGASSGRAIIGCLDGGELTLEEVHRFANGPIERGGSLFWDFDSQRAEIFAGLEKAVATGKPISGIAVDTWGVDYALLGADGAVKRPPYHYRDSRTDDIPQKVYQKVPEAELYQRTGIQFMQLNTIFQLAAHLGKHPGDFADANLLFMPDAFTHALCGDIGCEYTEASTSELLDARRRDWDFELIDKLGLPREVFPAVKPPCSRAGVLRPEIADRLGCGAIPVYRVGSHDTASAVGSVPATASGNWAYISCGTWALLGAEIAAPILSEAARAAAFTNEGGLDGKIRFLTNIMGMWLLQESRRVWNEAGKNISFAAMEEMAAAAAPLKFLVNPNDASFFTPGDMPARIREFCVRTGQGKIDGDAALVRCVYDSLALYFRRRLGDLGGLLGKPVERLHIVGGGTKDKLLMRLAAAATGVPVVAGPVEATAVGNIVAQAMAAGEIESLAEGRALVARSFPVETFEPSPELLPDLAAAVTRFERL